MSSAGGARRRLLIRDLAQVATPKGTGAPLRGKALADVEVIDNAFVLCSDGVIESVGAMSTLAGIDGDYDEIDGRGLCAIPGLVTAQAASAPPAAAASPQATRLSSFSGRSASHTAPTAIATSTPAREYARRIETTAA